MNKSERQKLIKQMDDNLLHFAGVDKIDEFSIDHWLSENVTNPSKPEGCCMAHPTECPSTKSSKSRTQENAEKLIKIGGYPAKVMSRMKTLCDKEQYQAVLETAAKFDSFVRWAEMVGMTEAYIEKFEYDPDAPLYEGRPIDMEGEL